LIVAGRAKSDPLYERVENKFRLIDSGRAARGSVILFSPDEVNAWARTKVPQVVNGVKDPRIEFGLGTLTGYATVDFLRMRQNEGVEVNPLASALLSGERPVSVAVRVESAKGMCTVFLTSVQLSGATISGSILKFLVKTFFTPMFPDAKIDQPFELKDTIERIDVKPDGVRVFMKK
jgi:hypothetical protein